MGSPNSSKMMNESMQGSNNVRRKTSPVAQNYPNDSAVNFNLNERDIEMDNLKTIIIALN